MREVDGETSHGRVFYDRSGSDRDGEAAVEIDESVRHLEFGDGQVVVVDGRRAFRPLPAGDPEIDLYLHAGSDLDDREAAAAARARDLSASFGRSLLLVHDRRARRLEILSDRYAHLPFFLERRDGKLRLASRLDALLGGGGAAPAAAPGPARRLNRAALADILLLNVPLGTKTLVEGIASFPAACRMSIDLADGAATQTRTWDPATLLLGEQRPLADTQQDLFDSFMQGFDQAVRGERVAVTLSGGIDSRCLLAAALDRHLSVTAFNCSVPGSRAARYAETMARRTKVPYRAYPVGDDFSGEYAERLRGVLGLTEGMTFASEVECHWLRERLSDATVVLHGAFAELSKLDSMHLYFVDDAVRRATRATLAQVIWRRHQPPLELFLPLVAPELRDELRRAARESLAARIDGMAPGLAPDQALQAMYIEEFLPKVTKCSSVIWNDRIRTRFPFAYPPYVDLLLRTRSADRMSQTFQMRLLQRTSPLLFRFPNANTGLRVDAPRFLITAARTLDRARRVVFMSRGSLGHSDQGYWVTHMRPAPEEILLDRSSGGLFDGGAVERLLRELRQPPPVSWNPVRTLTARGERQRKAMVVQKAMMLRLWIDRTKVSID
jgi:asparagine synthase (glutamine-hydrolysing)